MKVDDLHSPRKRKVNDATDATEGTPGKKDAATRRSNIDEWVHISAALASVLASIPHPSSGDDSDDK